MPSSANVRLMLSPVPTGTVDFITSAWRSDGGMRRHHGAHGRQVGVAGVGRRRADGHEQQARVLERVGQVGREVQAAAVARDEVLEARLPDRDPALP